MGASCRTLRKRARATADGDQAPPRPRDPISLGKPIGDIATGQVVDAAEDKPAPERTRRPLHRSVGSNQN
jgi:hypothetical protein